MRALVSVPCYRLASRRGPTTQSGNQDRAAGEASRRLNSRSQPMAREAEIPRAIFACARSALRVMKPLSDKRQVLCLACRAGKLNHPGEGVAVSEPFSCQQQGKSSKV